MNAEKNIAIKALDEKLDTELIKYAEKFVRNPDICCLKILCMLVTVDEYTDEYLEKIEEEPEIRVSLTSK